ncbi:helix-turn-helix domain-containing protein [Microbispora bryophytorum]|uniref:helix-turn-helix domain-containing protein n=1 Tax=Microbispora bryophytorum TaxID=1460882 RepID=UPI0037C96C3F
MPSGGRTRAVPGLIGFCSWLVFAGHRDGGQRQFVERPVPDPPDESLAPVLAWAREQLDVPLTVSDLAARAAVSPATLHRRFRAQLGTTPLAWLTGERLALACRMIERGESGLDISRAAQRAGHRRQSPCADAARDRAQSVGVPGPVRIGHA